MKMGWRVAAALLILATAIKVSEGSNVMASSDSSQLSFTVLMTKKGCAKFAALLLSFPEAQKAYEDNVGGGLTIFCPVDDAVDDFTDDFKNLTAEGKSSLLLFHGTPYYNSLETLKTQNGVVTTLATTGNKNYNMTVQNDGNDVTLETKSGTSKITGTVVDEEPLAAFTIDKVLKPWELFKVDEAPAPAPMRAPGKKAPAPLAAAGPSEVTDDRGPKDANAAPVVRGWRGCSAAGAAIAAAVLLL
ncbi:fasciclin-like arabinogalactan protein 2 [Wolffia australiana]